MCCEKCTIKESQMQLQIDQLEKRVYFLMAFISINGLKDRLDSVDVSK